MVLDMGEPVRMRDLAENMIRLSGLEPHRDIVIEYVGLRPGEKMHEELFYGKEKLVGTEHPKLMLANCIAWRFEDVIVELSGLQTNLIGYDSIAIVKSIQRLVPEFKRYTSDAKDKEVSLMKSGAESKISPQDADCNVC